MFVILAARKLGEELKCAKKIDLAGARVHRGANGASNGRNGDSG